jgi:hypothetical protein
MGAVHFPINPAFIFPFVPLFLYLFFEFAINKNAKFIPYIILVVSLGIQLHYSVATLYFVPIAFFCIFRQKIPLKTVFVSALVALVCFAPYIIHKQTSFVPQSSGNKVIKGLDRYPTEKAIKIPFLGNTIERITIDNNYRWKIPKAEKIGWVYYAVTTLSFWFLLFYVLIKCRKNGAQNYRKEIAVLTLFYVPSLIYELSGPGPSYWYAFIFVMPHTLLISYSFNLFFRKVNTSLYKVIIVGVISSTIIFLTWGTFKHINSTNRVEGFVLWDYKKVKKFYITLTKKLNLSVSQLKRNVYFEAESGVGVPFSEYFPKSFFSETEKNKTNDETTCYYLIDRTKFRQRGTLRLHRHKTFLKDPTIRVSPPIPLSFSEIGSGIPRILSLYKYTPIKKQPCFYNLPNKYFVEKQEKNLLSASKSLDVDRKIDIITLSQTEKYDSNSEIELFEKTLLAHSSLLDSAFKFKITLRRGREKFTLKNEIQQHFHYPFVKYIDYMYVSFCPVKDQDNDSCEHYAVIPTAPSLSSTFKAYNQFWFRENEIPLSKRFLKGKTFIYLIWSATVLGKDNYDVHSQTIEINSILLNRKTYDRS